MTKQKGKQCRRCKETKLLADFHKDKTRRDGLYPECKQCRKRYNVGKEETDFNLTTWEQAESALRTMAELQAAINTEEAACRDRIKMIKNYSAEAIEPWKANLNLLKTKIKSYVLGLRFPYKKSKFGMLRVRDGKVIIKLNTSYATNHLEKP